MRAAERSGLTGADRERGERHGGKKEKPRETERERFRGNEWEVGAESGRLILWIYVVCFQSAE